MGWSDIATEDSLGRSERAIAAMLGTLSNPYNETFANELVAITDELEDSDETLRLLSCLSAAAAIAISNIAVRGLEPTEDDESPEREAAERAAKMDVLQQISDVIRSLSD